LVADGSGGGGVSGNTFFVGSGNAGAFRLLLLLLFALLFSFVFSFSVGLKSGDTAAFAFGLAFTFADGLIDPPEGNPSSGLPVAGDATWTG